MRPLTDTTGPSRWSKVREAAPLPDRGIDRLVAAGVTLIVVNTQYKAEMIKAHLAGRKGCRDPHLGRERRAARFRRRHPESAAAFRRRAVLSRQCGYRLGRRREPSARKTQRPLEFRDDGRADAARAHGEHLLLRRPRRFHDGQRGRSVPRPGRAPLALGMDEERELECAGVRRGEAQASSRSIRLWDKAIGKDRLFGMRPRRRVDAYRPARCDPANPRPSSPILRRA